MSQSIGELSGQILFYCTCTLYSGNKNTEKKVGVTLTFNYIRVVLQPYSQMAPCVYHNCKYRLNKAQTIIISMKKDPSMSSLEHA